VHLVPIGMRDRTQPAHQRQIHSRANAFEDALKKVVVRRYETRVDDTPRSVNDLFTWLRSEFADSSDPPIANADRASGTHRIVWQASENTVRVADQHRGHLATPISLNQMPEAPRADRPICCHALSSKKCATGGSQRARAVNTTTWCPQRHCRSD